MLKIEDYNQGLIYTEVNGCIDCNKCIHECPVLKSNVSVMDVDGQFKMCVDDKECILCGKCMETCVHDVRHFRDDSDDFFSELRQGKEFSLIIAPAFYLNYPNEYKKILGYLKSLGVRSFYPVSFGADIAVWGYVNYLENKETDGYIAQPCPSVVSHIEKHLPELLPRIIPIQSPMMCTAIYLKKYKKIEENLAFLSPCIAKKTEINSKRGQGLIRHNVTFTRLVEHINRNGVNIESFPDAEEEFPSGMGSLFPHPGGLGKNIEYYLGLDAMVMQVEGEHKAYKYLQTLSNERVVPTLIDILNCEHGCGQGTGTDSRNINKNDISYRYLALRKKMQSFNDLPPSERLKQLNNKFKELNIEDFTCEYERDNTIRSREISDTEIDEILQEKLMKLTDNDGHVDCSACGYKTCRQMAEAIALGINHQDNCVYYTRNVLAISIKEKVAAELELQENTRLMEERLKVMLNASPILCAIYDKSYKVIEANQAAATLFGLTDKQVYIDRFHELVPEFQPCGTRSTDKVKIVMDYAFEHGQHYFEWIHKTLDDIIIPCDVYLQRERIGDKTVVVAFARDMRDQYELKKTLVRLEEVSEREKFANQAKTRFLARMSHEIRTPMNSIMGISELQLQNTHPPETKDAFYRIFNSSNLLLAIINDILDLSKVEAGKMEIIPIEYKTANMIINTVQLNLMYIGSKRIEFKLEVDENLPLNLIGDELRLKQILNNVLSNAFKYTLEGSVTLRFLVEKSDNPDEIFLVICVSDTGQGMTKEQVESLFGGEFIRFNLEYNREIEGSGLGLNIVYQLVEMMGGEISIESEPQKGSDFTIRLPQKIKDNRVLGTKMAKDLQNLKDTQFSAKRLSGFEREPMPYGKVLVVDDVESNLFVAKGILMPYKIAIDTVDSGTLAIEKIKSGAEYDIIFMDHMMPGLDGVETTKILRDMGYKHPIIALTANAFSDMKEMFIESGFTDYASKPIDFKQLDKFLMQYIRDKRPSDFNYDAKNISMFHVKMTQIWESCEFYDIDSAIEALESLEKSQYPTESQNIINEIEALLSNGDTHSAGEVARKASVEGVSDND